MGIPSPCEAKARPPRFRCLAVTPERTPPGATSQDGFALIEVLISAVIVVVISTAVFALLTATGHASAEERHRSEAYAVAQEDQARLRSMRVPSLDKLNETRTVTLNGTPFTIESTGVFVNDKTGTSSCGKESSSADYVKITTKVSWPSTGKHAPVTIASIVTPPNGALDPSHGTLTVSAIGGNNGPMAGIGLSGTGAGTFSGTTDSSGCAMFPDQAAGNYTLTPSAPGLVDKDGNPPSPMTVGVVAGSTSTVTLRYDLPGSIPVEFTTLYGGNLISSSADSIIVYNTEMTSAKMFTPPGGSPGGPRAASITAKSLFPFSTPDTVYAGSCEGNNPNPKGETNPPGAAAIASVTVPAGGTVTPAAKIQLPALNLTVKNGASLVNGAKVTVSDNNCSVSGNPVKRVYSTDANGNLFNSTTGKTDPGLPWGTYNICASATIASVERRLKVSNVVVQNLATGTTLTMDLSGSGSESGNGKTCP